MWFRSLLLALVLSAPARAAQPTVFDVAPDDAHLIAYVRNLDSALGAIDELRATLRAVGLGDEGFRWLAETSKREVGIDLLDRKALGAAGLDLSRGAAMYRLPGGQRQPVFAVAVSGEKAFADTTADMAGRMFRSKAKAKKRSQGGATFHELTGDDEWDRMTFAVRDGFAFFGPDDQALEFVATGAFLQAAAAGRFPDEGDAIDVGLWVDFAGAAATTQDYDVRQLGASVGDLVARFQVGSSGIRYAASASVGSALQPFLKHLEPRFSDEARQTAVLGALKPGRGGIVRLLIPTDGLVALLEQTGALAPELRAEIRRELGFDLKDDLLDVLLGDLSVVTPHGLSDMRLEMSVRDAGAMEKTVRKLLELADADRHLTVTTRAVDAGFETTFQGDGRDAWFAPRICWGFVGGRLVVALTPRGLALAATKDGVGLAAVTSPLARAHLTQPATLFAWSPVDNALFGLHDVVSVVRRMVSEEASGWIDLFDVLSLWLDQATESALVLRLDGQKMELTGEIGLLRLAPGAPESTPEGAYTAALALVYSGAVEDGLRALGQVALRFPETPYGRKADGAVYSSGSVLGMYAMAAPLMSSAMYLTMARAYEPAPAEWSPPVAAAPAPSDPCLVWARDVCYYKGADTKECKKAEKLLAAPTKKASKAERRQCALDLFEMRGY
ncbi:MAG: hypothetical protein AMXMBFR64_05780 [Myxococcales bacterium]